MSEELMTVEELREILERGRGYMRVPVRGMPGLFIVRHGEFMDTPRRCMPAKLTVDVNLLREDGSFVRESMVAIYNLKELEAHRRRVAEEVEALESIVRIMSYDMVEVLLEVIEKVNRLEPVTSEQYPSDVVGIPVEELVDMLEWGREWTKIPVRGMPGLSVVKVPAVLGQPARITYLALEINPVRKDGTPIHGRGYLLKSRKELKWVRTRYKEFLEEARHSHRILSHPAVERLVMNVDEVNRSWFESWKPEKIWVERWKSLQQGP